MIRGTRWMRHHICSLDSAQPTITTAEWAKSGKIIPASTLECQNLSARMEIRRVDNRFVINQVERLKCASSD